MPSGALADKDKIIHSCVDLYASILNMIECYVPVYHINIDIDRMNVDHNFIRYFTYPKTVSFREINPKIIGNP